MCCERIQGILRGCTFEDTGFLLSVQILPLHSGLKINLRTIRWPQINIVAICRNKQILITDCKILLKTIETEMSCICLGEMNCLIGVFPPTLSTLFISLIFTGPVTIIFFVLPSSSKNVIYCYSVTFFFQGDCILWIPHNRPNKHRGYKSMFVKTLLFPFNHLTLFYHQNNLNLTK